MARLHRLLKSRRFWAVAAVVAVAAIWHLAAAPPRVEPGVPWRIEFGRGSGMQGLETVKVASDGAVVVHRLARQADLARPLWETTSLALPPDAVAEVLGSVEKNGVLGLRRRYAAGVHDGTQWVFWFRQGGTEKASYFDNEFPAAVRRFAADLDRVLAENGLGGATWRPVPDTEAREHERELWDSIHR